MVSSSEDCLRVLCKEMLARGCHAKMMRPSCETGSKAWRDQSTIPELFIECPAKRSESHCLFDQRPSKGLLEPTGIKAWMEMPPESKGVSIQGVATNHCKWLLCWPPEKSPAHKVQVKNAAKLRILRKFLTLLLSDKKAQMCRDLRSKVQKLWMDSRDTGNDFTLQT